MRALTPRLLIAISIFGSATLVAHAQARGAANNGPLYTTLYYQNGPLKLEAYRYRPAGAGPFPVVIYNHGSRAGQERTEQPIAYVGRLLAAAGYMTLVPERRGYGQSGGETFVQEVGSDRGQRFVERMHAETSDVLASFDLLKADHDADMTRLGVMGWSFGGIVSTFAAARSEAFRAAIVQAPAALVWTQSPVMQQALRDAAGRIRAPTLCQSSRNDATTANAEAVCAAVKGSGTPVQLILYPPFLDAPPGQTEPAGHLIFGARGLPIWAGDVLKFLAEHLPKPGALGK
jgi:dienelactone hydrolase